MTTYIMCSVRDVKAGLFGQPFFAANEMAARRSVHMEVNSKNPQSLLAQYPGDFELVRLGYFSDEDGQVVLDMAHILNLQSLVEASAPAAST